MKCPNCKLENMEDSLRCDCGYDFSSGSVKASYLNINSALNTPSLPLLIFGWICSALGGWIGIIIACHIVFSKDKQIKTIHRFNEKSRKQGWAMLIIAIISFILTLIYRMYF